MFLFPFLYNFSITILYFCLLYYLFYNSLQSLIYGKFPNAKKLPSGHYFILFDKGINIYDSNFSLNKSLCNFSGNEIIGENDYEKTVISYYKTNNNNYYILCFIKGTFLYIFNNSNCELAQITIQLNCTGKYYYIIPYKYNETSLEYIISFIYEYYDFYFFYFSHFQINLPFITNNNHLIGVLVVKEMQYQVFSILLKFHI